MKCFRGEELHFRLPDGTPGSGLNLLVGNNGCGKTTVLEALNYLYSGRYAESRIDINDFADPEEPILIEASLDRFRGFSPDSYRKHLYFVVNGLRFSAKSRDIKQRGRFLSSPINANTVFELDEDTYYRKSDDAQDRPKGQDKSVVLRDLYFDTTMTDTEPVSVFLFDRSRSRHLGSGTFQTSFDRICDDLNWRFRKKLRATERTAEYHDAISNHLTSLIFDIAGGGAGEKVSAQLADFFGEADFEKVRVNLIDALQPFTSSFLAMPGKSPLTQIKARNLGSGIEFVFALLFQKYLSEQTKGGRIYLVDEPELHLHPAAQRQMARILLEESVENLIVVSTHSPYMLKNLVKCSGLTILTSKGGDFRAEYVPEGVGIFPWSPTYAEVSYRAFGLATEEFHNELYGFIQWKKEISSVAAADDFLVGQGVRKDCRWIDDRSKKEQDRTICSYVRNAIHHPENQLNREFEDAELKKSIEILLQIIGRLSLVEKRAQ